MAPRAYWPSTTGAGASSELATELSSAFNSLPILKYGIFFGGTSTFSPVFGLRPLRGARLRKRKEPKPRISTSCPVWSAETMLRRAASTMIPACSFPIVRQPQDARLNVVLSNSFGFGGVNATLILRRWA